MDSFSLVSFLSPVRISGLREARNPDPRVVVPLKREKAPPPEIVSILNQILPPREFEESGFKWRQVVSTKQVKVSKTFFYGIRPQRGAGGTPKSVNFLPLKRFIRVFLIKKICLFFRSIRSGGQRGTALIRKLFWH